MFEKALDDDTVLRLLTTDSAEELFNLVDKNREFLRPWLAWVDKTKSASDSRSFIEFTLENAKSGTLTLGIYLQGKLVGIAGYHPIDFQNRKVALGYWLDKNYNGRGIVTKSVQFLVDHAFSELNLRNFNLLWIGLAVDGLPMRMFCYHNSISIFNT